MSDQAKDAFDKALQMYKADKESDEQTLAKPRSIGYSLASISEMHRLIAQLLVEGMKPIAIAEELGIHKQTVYNVKNEPAIQRYMDFLRAKRDNGSQHLVALARQGAEASMLMLLNIIDDETAPLVLRAKVAEQFVNRGLGKPDVKPQTGHGTGVTQDQLEEIKQRSKAILHQRGDIVEAEFEEVSDGKD